MERILIVEDDREISSYLKEFLEGEGFAVSLVSGQKDALEIIKKEKFSLALIDISLSDGNGYAVCSAVKAKTDTPVIFVTASGDEFSVVAGLDMGADDYIAKPFRPREMLSRIKSVLRRTRGGSPLVEIEDLKVDMAKGLVMKGKEEVFLSALEYRLLLIFINNKGKVLSRNKLLEEVWDIAGDFVNDNTLTVYIKRLREKIEKDPQEPSIIKTVRGLGYKMD